MKDSNKFKPQDFRRRLAHAGKSTLEIGGVPSQLASFVVAESSVLRTNFCYEKSAHRQSANRYSVCLNKEREK